MPKIADQAATDSKPARPKSKLRGADGEQPKPSSVPVKPSRPVIYPELAVNGIPIPWESTIVTQAIMKGILGWETEEEWIARGKAEDPTLEARLKAEGKALGYGKDYMAKDEYNNKIRCVNNDANRPFDEGHARKLAQDILNREWAGRITMGDLQEFAYEEDDPYTMLDGTVLSKSDKITLPEGTCNGEAIIVGRTGQAESVQHRGWGLILACQMWAKDEPGGYWRQRWPEEPVIESIIITGVSESPRVIKTLDNVKPRTLSDVFYTSPLFQNLGDRLDKEGNALFPDPKASRKELSRMLAVAVKFLMQRVGELNNAASHAWAATHSESLGFTERHSKLLDCLYHLLVCNRGRVISNMQLSPGQMTALMYLMGSSASKLDDYRSTSPPCEAALKWTRWKKACDFWSAVGSGDEKVMAIQACLKGLEDPDGGLTGRLQEKLVILSRAWTAWVEGKEITEALIDLRGKESATGDYKRDKEQKLCLIAPNNFGGPDLGERPELKDDKLDQPSMEAAKAQIRRQRAEEMATKLLAERQGLAPKPDNSDKSLAKEAEEILARRTAKAPGEAESRPAAPKVTQAPIPQRPVTKPAASGPTTLQPMPGPAASSKPATKR